MTPHRVPPRAAAAGPSRRARARDVAARRPRHVGRGANGLAGRRRDAQSGHRRRRRDRGGDARRATARDSERDRERAHGARATRCATTTRDDAGSREGASEARGGSDVGVDARAGVAWIGSDGRGGDAIRGDARVSRDGGRRRAGTRRAGRRAARAWARSDAFASREVSWDCVGDARWSGEWMRRARMGWRRDARANERLTRRRRFPRTRAGVRERVRRGR